MTRKPTYEDYPWWIVAVSNSVSLSIYAIGAYLLARLWIWLLPLYLAMCLWLEVRLLREACANCAYYGQVCAFGKGKLCALVLPQGDAARFTEKEISWQQILPDMLVSILPTIGGIVLLVMHGWDWLIAGLLALLLGLAFAGTGFVRGTLACPHCRQRELGCPAEQLFAQSREAGDGA